MATRDLKQSFLQTAADRISRYCPVIELEFGICLGDVRPRELRTGDWLDAFVEGFWAEWPRHILAKKGRAPSRFEEVLARAEATLIRAVAPPFLFLRFWWPDLFMQWNERDSSIWIAFYGWSREDYERNMLRIDQYVVHEMAHGVWNRIARAERNRLGESMKAWRRWRLWSEGFAHYLADVHFRGCYPPHVVVSEDWSDFRKRGKHLVVELVKSRGSDVLREIPLRWAEYTATS